MCSVSLLVLQLCILSLGVCQDSLPNMGNRRYSSHSPESSRRSNISRISNDYRYSHHYSLPKSSARSGLVTRNTQGYQNKVLGLYILLADDTEEGFESNAFWSPQLYEWQQSSANVLFFTFIHPGTMEIPPAFISLTSSRGTDRPGAVPADTLIIFAIGGYAYSKDIVPWRWLRNRRAAERMAEEVATWPEVFGCDGVDLDLEEGAGDHPDAGRNMIHFIRRLKQLKPEMIVSQPVYGYPQVPAETEVINASWDTVGRSNNLADSVGLMVYESTTALNYVNNYARGTSRWQGFPVRVNVPKNSIMLGAKGQTSSRDLRTLASESIKQDLLGIMVWYASVKNGFQYESSWDASTDSDSIRGYMEAMNLFRRHNY